MSENLKNKSVMIYDNRMWVSLAERLAKDFGQVKYFSPWKEAFPQKKNAVVGEGLVDVERVNSFWDHVPETDLFIFPDILDGDIQMHLEDLGKKVWGSRHGDQLELNRIGMMKLQKKLGLPVIPYEVVKGMDDLRKYLKSHDDVWVKISTFRGSIETFHAVNYKYIEFELNNLEHELGAWKDEQEFICEQNTPDCTEFGYDGFNVDGDFPTKNPFGCEVKDMGYICRMIDYKNLPEPILNFNAAISPYLKKWGYKNHFSTETRINKKGIGFTTDITTRMPSPPGELMMYQTENYSELIWEGANGNCIDPIVKEPYGVELIIKCDWAKKNTLNVQFPEKYKDNIKLKSYLKHDGSYYVIPGEVGLAEIGVIVTAGKTKEEACKKAEEIAEEVRASYIDIPFDALEKAQKEIDKLKEFGYDIFK